MSEEIRKQNQFAEDACMAFAELARRCEKIDLSLNLFSEAVARMHFKNSRYDKSKNRI